MARTKEDFETVLDRTDLVEVPPRDAPLAAGTAVVVTAAAAETAAVEIQERSEIAVIGLPTAVDDEAAVGSTDVDLAVTVPPAVILATREGDVRLRPRQDQPCL